jgi:hypothetical protein
MRLSVSITNDSWPGGTVGLGPELARVAPGRSGGSPGLRDARGPYRARLPRRADGAGAARHDGQRGHLPAAEHAHQGGHDARRTVRRTGVARPGGRVPRGPRRSWSAAPASAGRCGSWPATPTPATCSTSPTVGARSGTSWLCEPGRDGRGAVRALFVLPSGSLNHAALKRPASKTPCASVLSPGWSYDSKTTPRDASSAIVWSRSSTNHPFLVGGESKLVLVEAPRPVEVGYGQQCLNSAEPS